MIAGAAFAKGPDAEKERAEVIKVINTSIKWCFPDKSRERLYGSVVNDSTYFMFQPDSKSTVKGIDGYREFAERVFMVDACQPKGSTIKELRVVLSRSGDVAWFSCLLDDWGDWDGKPAWFWRDIRWTGVLEKIDGKWLVMQQHFSSAEDAVRAQVIEELKATAEKKETSSGGQE
jgi:ketosteroid isomerase-like protein